MFSCFSPSRTNARHGTEFEFIRPLWSSPYARKCMDNKLSKIFSRDSHKPQRTFMWCVIKKFNAASYISCVTCQMPTLTSDRGGYRHKPSCPLGFLGIEMKVEIESGLVRTFVCVCECVSVAEDLGICSVASNRLLFKAKKENVSSRASQVRS